ncbi:MAG: endonuclease domain-containing protein [Rhodospirillales bacterium]|nr:endonuclease domain-containing protein [Alphaproteobacteria bacterium]MCB9986984.1 endonuclease domain-containing protein [Rhodospirillales bacterium]USO08242.1 MAG: endonuclease domain-containing protein [Rhodospirillales bacterium]
MTAPAFIFESFDFDAASGVLSLRYAFEGAEKFEERITFPAPETYDHGAAERIFRLIFLLAGVSYYKTRAPRVLKCPAFAVDADTAAFVTRVYTLGLAEFAYKNRLDLAGHIQFSGHGTALGPLRLAMKERILIPVGGGKDSIVTLEALRRHNPTLFALGAPGGAAQPIADTIRVSGLTSIYVSRLLSPQLGVMNARGAYNGHVPITAILSAIAVACAILYGYRAVVLSNEHSASVPNFDDVNHQYSKSLEFERDFAGWLAAHVSPDIAYFSFLRPLSEIAIAQRFARHGAYHDIFRSCNTAFRQDAAARGTHWCRNCPKCRFVFLALAPFVERTRLAQIFGGNMLDDMAQAEGFAELCGVAAFKPFECVGEVEESAAALAHLAQMPEWRDDAVVAALAGRVRGGNFAALFDLYPDHRVPPAYLGDLA